MVGYGISWIITSGDRRGGACVVDISACVCVCVGPPTKEKHVHGRQCAYTKRTWPGVFFVVGSNSGLPFSFSGDSVEAMGEWVAMIEEHCVDSPRSNRKPLFPHILYSWLLNSRHSWELCGCRVMWCVCSFDRCRATVVGVTARDKGPSYSCARRYG